MSSSRDPGASSVHFNLRVEPSLDVEPSELDPLELHRRLPGYAPTPLASLPQLAERLGIGEVRVKDESARLGLPSFKVLGASWATVRALSERFDGIAPDLSIARIAARLARELPLELVTATEGNHGRAVARVAGWLGLGCRIFVPRDMAREREQAIAAEGAQLVRVDGNYDAAVEAAGRAAGDRALLIQDTGWPGYERVPAWVIDGYGTLGREIDEQLASEGRGGPDLVLVQIGVGSLATGVVRHYRDARRTARPTVVGVEPAAAACALAALRAGRVVTLPDPAATMTAGLNCGRVASVALPWLEAGLAAVVTVGNERVAAAMRELAAVGIVSGASGAAGLAGLEELLLGPDADRVRSRLAIGPGSRALVISTEGATDRALYERVTA